MAQMISNFLEGQALCYQMHCTRVAQRVRSMMQGMKFDICHASTDNIVETAGGERLNGCFKRKEYLAMEVLWPHGL